MTSSNPTALITGASAGLGREFAKLFARNGHDLVLVARNGAALASFADELERQFGVNAKPFPLDLTGTQSGWPCSNLSLSTTGP